jgi:isochorismate synthase
MTARLLEAIESGQAFAICQLPGTNDVLEFFQNGNDLIDLNGRVWIAEPFDKEEKAKHQLESTTRAEHIAAVIKAIEKLQTAELDKVVVSKIKKVELPFSIDSDSIQKAFEILSTKYPNAFVFIYRMNVHSVWLGATPETLIERNNGVFRTMSLAGTRLKSEHNLVWGEKEKREQQVVTDFIANSIQKNGGEDLQVSPPFTATAAHLEHLKSTIEFHSSKSLFEWANVLHPTPAICGLPVANAKSVISQIESHSRKMYAGYIGFFDNSGNGKVFVQLRCMEWLNGNALIYSGGGIMPDSNPESEWEEAENKANVMLSVLETLKN